MKRYGGKRWVVKRHAVNEVDKNFTNTKYVCIVI